MSWTIIAVPNIHGFEGFPNRQAHFISPLYPEFVDLCDRFLPLEGDLPSSRLRLLSLGQLGQHSDIRTLTQSWAYPS